MLAAGRRYLLDLFEAVGTGWNQFWFKPMETQHLAVLRIVVGLVAIYLHATLFPDLERLFAHGGLLPSETVKSLVPSASLSYYHLFQSATGLWVVHGFGLLVLILFCVGFLTRVTSILSLIVVLATCHRAPMLMTQVEPVLCFAIAYLCLGPCGRVLSIDSWRRKRISDDECESAVRPQRLISATISTRLLQIHTCLVCMMMGITMLSGPNATWWYGEAIWFLMARPESQLIDMTWLHEATYILNAWSHEVVLFSILFPILVWPRILRPAFLAWAIVHWAGLAIISGIAPFCLLMMGLLLAFAEPYGKSFRSASIAR